MIELGETFRSLRKERGFTLKTMSHEIISFSYLSKFEKGESDITINNLIKLIERLNMTLDEFLYFNQIRTTNYLKLFQDISFAYGQNDKLTLEKYYAHEKALYEKTKNVNHKNNHIMIAIIIKDIDDSFFIPKTDIDFLVDYITKCSFWTTYEVALLGNTLTFFSENLLLILLKEIKKRLADYRIYNRNERDLISLIENACIILLRKDNVQEARSLSCFLESYLRSSYFFEKTRKLFIDGLILILDGERNSGCKQAEQAIEIMNLLDKNFANDHEAELRSFLMVE